MGKGENKVKNVPCLFLCRLREYRKAHAGFNPEKILKKITNLKKQYQ
jgi:hypothetical protein